MTCFALLLEWFVNHDERLISHSNWKMAFLALHFRVRAIELESAVAIMNEQKLIPQTRLMALLAARLLLFSKLAEMSVLMAIRAAESQRLIAHETGWKSLRGFNRKRISH